MLFHLFHLDTIYRGLNIYYYIAFERRSNLSGFLKFWRGGSFTANCTSVSSRGLMEMPFLDWHFIDKQLGLLNISVSLYIVALFNYGWILTSTNAPLREWNNYQLCQLAVKYHVPYFTKSCFWVVFTATWSKKSIPNRGLPAAGSKTAVQSNIILERMFWLITQFVPTLRRNDFIKKSTSLNYIWQRIGKHYSLWQSEVNFLKLSTIKYQADEWKCCCSFWQ